MATVKEVFALVVQADVAGGAQAIRTFAQGARRDLEGVEGASAQMYAALQSGGARVAAAGAAGVAALAALGTAARKEAGEIVAFQRVAGGSVEEVSKLRFAAQQTGVDLEQLSTGLVRLSRSASTERGAETLARYGIEARNAAGEVRPLGDLLTDIAGAVANLPNGAEKNDLVQQLFGRGGAQLLPLLNRGADGLEAMGVKAAELGEVMRTDTVEAAKRYTAAQRDLNVAVEALGGAIGEEVLPTLTAVNEALASLATGAARSVENLPEGFRQTAVAGGLAVSTVAAVGGTVASTIGSYGLAAQGVSALSATFGGLGAAAVAIGAPLALAATAVGGFLAALAQLNDQQQEAIELQAVSTDRIRQTAIVRSEAARRAAADDVAVQLARRQRVGPIDAGDRIQDFFGQYGAAQENDNRAALAEQALRNVKAAIADLPRDQAVGALDEIGAAMRRAGISASEVKKTLGPLYTQFGQTGPIDEGTAAIERYKTAVEQAAQKGVTLRQALDGLADGVDPGELTVYADSLGASLDPVYGLIDANQRLADAQAKAATSAKRDTSGIESAYRSLAAAKQRLDDILKGDGEDRRQVSPEVQIADARRRILEANAQIAQNPQDADALSARDEALADLDRATARRQQLDRESVQKEREVRDARQAVADAERELGEARRQSDEEYAQAQRDAADEVLRAGVEQRRAALLFADAMLTGKLKVDDVAAQLQLLVDQGILPQAVKDEFVGKMLTLTQQAGLAAAALQQIAQTPPPSGAATTAAPTSVAQRGGIPARATDRPTVAPGRVSPTPVARTAASFNPIDPLFRIRDLPAKPYTAAEQRAGTEAKVKQLVNSGSWSALIDLMSKRGYKFPGFQYGGIVGGFGGPDSQIIRATPGEGIVNPAGMRVLGGQGLAAINSGRAPAIAGGPTYHDTVTNNITLVAPDVERGASLVQRKIERSRRNRARRRTGAR